MPYISSTSSFVNHRLVRVYRSSALRCFVQYDCSFLRCITFQQHEKCISINSVKTTECAASVIVLQNELGHSILTPAQPVLALVLQHQAPGRVPTKVPTSMNQPGKSGYSRQGEGGYWAAGKGGGGAITYLPLSRRTCYRQATEAMEPPLII